MKYLNRQKGEVSLFVVIFATLLLTIVTVSYVRLMINNQQQASTIDLSQSAFDSAQAGIEDAKRAILHYQTVCGDPSKVNECNTAKNQINSNSCNAFAAAGGLSDLTNANATSEVIVQNNSTSNSLDQAYTCATIQLNTSDYVGTLDKDGSEIIPLFGVDGTFDSVQINWFTKGNFSSVSPSLQSAGMPLLSNWPQSTPPIIRAQLIQFSSNGFTLNDFDDKNGTGQTNTNTVFLYPSLVGINQYAFVNDIRRSVNPSSPGEPLPVKCQNNLTSAIYACSVKLTLPTPIGAGNRTAFLRLTSLYNNTSYQVSMTSPTNVISFNAVQPMIDSTGRASDMFRRVQARVKLNSNFPYPNAEIFTDGNLCKNFLVTDNADDFANNNANLCTP